MLSTFREEPIPFYYNPRHVQKIEKDQYRERPVFKGWQDDSADVIAMMMNHDSKIWALRKICESELEYKRLESIIVTNLSLFTDTYHYL